jgi:hypothetical protein
MFGDVHAATLVHVFQDDGIQPVNFSFRTSGLTGYRPVTRDGGETTRAHGTNGVNARVPLTVQF